MSLLNDPGIIVAGAVRSEIWIILGTGERWIDDEFVSELWIMIISTCPFLSSGTHLEEGSRSSNLSR